MHGAAIKLQPPFYVLAAVDGVHNVDVEGGQCASNWRLVLRGSAIGTAYDVIVAAVGSGTQGVVADNEVCRGEKQQDESRGGEHHEDGRRRYRFRRKSRTGVPSSLMVGQRSVKDWRDLKRAKQYEVFWRC